MRYQLYRLFSNRVPALLWSIIIFILLALPGNMLPNENHLAIPNLDKYVHIVLFGTFVFLWSLYFASKNEKKAFPIRKSLTVFIIACLYGTAMEYVQKYFIPNRDFDIYDIAADVVGAVLGFLIVRLTFSWFRAS
jgi:VanZ family protein